MARGHQIRQAIQTSCGITVLALALYSQQAAAQSADGLQSATATGTVEEGEILVTAQKRAENLRDVPIAITVVSPQILQSTNSRNLAELQGVVPGVLFGGNTGGGRNYITMRGATGLAFNTGDEPVAIYMDDVYLARGVTIGTTDLLDVGAIEVVRGPQGTLQGRNATAGAVLIRSADPTDGLSGKLSVNVETPFAVRTQGAISAPLAEGLAIRVAAGYVNDRGWAYNSFNNKHIGGGESVQGRVVLRYETGSFSARLVADYLWNNNQPALFRYASTNFNAGAGALVPAGTATPNTPLSQAARDTIFKRNRMSLNPGTDTTVESGGAALNIQYEFDGADLISITGLRRTIAKGLNDSDGLDTVKMGYNVNDDRSTQFSQELRLQSPGDRRFSWILGLYYFFEKQGFDDAIFNLQFTVPIRSRLRAVANDSDVQTRSYAAFADATFRLNDQLSVIGGVRYTYDKKKFDEQLTSTNLGTGVVTVIPYRLAGQTSAPTDSWDDVSYRAKLVYKPSDALTLFVGYGRGFRAGGYNPAAVQPAFKPESNASLELGAKGDLFDRTLSYSLAAYRNEYRNLQLRAGVPTGGAIITNAANALIKGVELEISARPTPATRLTGNIAYTDARFTSFPTARNTLDQPTDATGNYLPRTPKWQFFLSAAQDFDIGTNMRITTELNYRWRDRIYFFFTDQNAQPWQDPPGGELGARISLKPADDNWTLSIYATNLTNARIINTGGVTFSYPQVSLVKPRVLGASAEFKF